MIIWVRVGLPEKDCLGWLWLTFWQPEWKSSSESSELCNVSRWYRRLWLLTWLVNEVEMLLVRSKRTNHFLQSSQPITSQLTDKWPITSRLHWPIRLTTRDIYTICWRSTIHLTLKMTSAQVVKTSVKVTPNSSSQDYMYSHPDDHNLCTYVLCMFAPLLYIFL